MAALRTPPLIAMLLALLLTTVACAPTAAQVIPTARPTHTPTPTITPSRTPGINDATPTATPTRVPATPTGGPSPTSLFGPTRTPPPDAATPTRLAANAPRIEFFASDADPNLGVEPGSQVVLYWSTRGATEVRIYRLDATGARSEIIQDLPPDGQQAVSIRRAERGAVEFLLLVGEGDAVAEQRLRIPLSCPVAWFFAPAPDTCPDAEADQTLLIEAQFERGRMIYVQSEDTVYALFNDGAPNRLAWDSLPNRYDPAVHPEQDPNFVPRPGFYQPTGILGFAWRSSGENIRNRLGQALAPSVSYDGYVQRETQGDASVLYLNSADTTVLRVQPEGEAWQIITSN